MGHDRSDTFSGPPIQNPAFDVIVCNVQHQGDKQKDAHLLKTFEKLLVEGFSPYRLGRIHNDLPTVQNGQGQQIQNEQVDTDKRRYFEKPVKPASALLVTNIRAARQIRD